MSKDTNYTAERIRLFYSAAIAKLCRYQPCWIAIKYINWRFSKEITALNLEPFGKIDYHTNVALFNGTLIHRHSENIDYLLLGSMRMLKTAMNHFPSISPNSEEFYNIVTEYIQQSNTVQDLGNIDYSLIPALISELLRMGAVAFHDTTHESNG